MIRSARARCGLLLLALIAAACGGEDDVASETSNSPVPAETADADGGDGVQSNDGESPAEPTVAEDPTSTPEPEPTEAPPAPVRDFSDVDAFVAQFLDDTGLEGAGLIVVHRDDGVLHHEHYGTFTEDRISMIASTSKMISAGVLMNLDDRGLLDVDAPISEVVDWADDHPDMTPAQLVSNSSGLVGLLPNPAYPPYLCQWIPLTSLSDCAETVMTTDADDDDIAPPDTEFRYGGAQWQVAGAVAEAASGQSWAELIDEIYNQPCDVPSLGYLSLGQVNVLGGYPDGFDGDPSQVDPSDNPTVEAGVYITTGDYGTLLLMHLRGGECRGGQVFTQDALDTMHGDRIGDVYNGVSFTGGGYGMGWWVDADGVITDAGAWGALSWLDLDHDLAAYWIIEDEASSTAAVRDDLVSLVRAAVVGDG